MSSSIDNFEWLEDAIKDGYINSFNYNQFSDVKEIGKGGFGIIESAEWGIFERKVALKRLKKEVCQLDKPSIKEFLREIRLLMKASHHPNINKFYGVTKDESTLITNSAFKGMPGFIEPQCYLVPGYKRNKKSDIYSYGVILWEISTCQIPFPFFSLDPIKGTPKKFTELYKRCQEVNPDQRPNIKEIISTLKDPDINIKKAGSILTYPKIPLTQDYQTDSTPQEGI
ncbi:9411_t:CDS:2 [Acaulospora morrowiae]|uniref:9411_t:CDS:1 n=1 Tax=Acaulospora morrowiae TaxID=94023 RepID=A0A9N8ZFT0_9GLOM|nr:9411_t:CDS:2 [Acaulospora morrowiae]